MGQNDPLLHKLPMQLLTEKPGNYYNGCQRRSLLIRTDVSKLIITEGGEVMKCNLYGVKSEKGFICKYSGPFSAELLKHGY